MKEGNIRLTIRLYKHEYLKKQLFSVY